MIKVLLADDHPIVHNGLKQMFSETDDITITDEAYSGFELLNKIQNDFDVIILDISLPDMNGLDVLSQIKAVKPHIPILILSMYPEKQYAVRTIKLGASGYLTKENLPDKIITAIRKISQGEKYFTSTLASTMASYLNQYEEKLPHEVLSNREYQIMCMIASGDTLKEIAGKLNISVKTVSVHRTNIVRKLKVKSNVEIAKYVLDHNILL